MLAPAGEAAKARAAPMALSKSICSPMARSKSMGCSALSMPAPSTMRKKPLLPPRRESTLSAVCVASSRSGWSVVGFWKAAASVAL